MAIDSPVSFKSRLTADGEGGSWVVLPIPFDVQATFGSRGRISVSGTLNDVPFRSSIFPGGDGTHHMMVNKALQREADVGPGSEAAVTMAVDTEPRVVEIPADLKDALAATPAAGDRFSGLSDSAKNEFIRWIASAKREETRAARVGAAVERIAAGKRRVSG